MSEVYTHCAYMTTIRLYGTVKPVPVTVPARLITRKDEKGRTLAYVVLGVEPA
jgi:hypothetical protein